MTNYYTVLRRAINKARHNTEQSRAIIYSRARQALIDQLTTLEPPLDEQQITAEEDDFFLATREIEDFFADPSRQHSISSRKEMYYKHFVVSVGSDDPTRIQLRGAEYMRLRKQLTDDLHRMQASDKVKALQNRHALDLAIVEYELTLNEKKTALVLRNDESEEKKDPTHAASNSRTNIASKTNTKEEFLAQLAEMASPAPFVENGRLNAGPNPVYDKPNF